METVILMSACKADFHREKAVRTSAELLRDSGIAFFPLDIRRLLKNSFSHQIKLIPYKELGEISLKESADGITDPRTLSKDGFCMRVRDVLIDLGIDEKRIQVEGYGDQYPVDVNASERGRAQNRRVEIVFSDEKGQLGAAR